VNPGTASAPWATMNHAAQTIPDAGCTVWFADGVYSGPNEIARRFTQPATFASIYPYRAVLQDVGTVLQLNGATNVVVEGFELHHTGPGATGFLTYIDSHNGLPSENIVLRDNIFHDSYGNDLLKLLEASRFITIEGNTFSNAGPREQHIDVNSVTDVTIQDNVFFDAFELSGRANAADAKHDIVIKDSNDSQDGLVGSQRITVRRNVFLNWQGGRESFVQVGNDGKSYYEAADVRLENNLMIGNGPNVIRTAFGVAGARDVTFDANTVAGNLPTGAAYAFVVETKGFNPPNQNITFVNNVWSDPTGTMGAGATSGSNTFSDGDPATTSGLTLDNNLYWNGGAPIPPGNLLSPLVADARRVVADPGVNADQSSVTVPWWTGSAFLSGTTSIRREFERLVESYGRIPPGSPAIDRADPTLAPVDDILGLPREGGPDLGAYESRAVDDPPAAPTGLSASDAMSGGAVALSWDANSETDVAGYNIYRSTDPAAPTPWTKVNGSPIPGTVFTDTGLANGTTYWYELTAVDAASHESPPSASSSATPSDATPPAAPTGLAATDAKTGGTLSLSWSANTEADLAGYDVFRTADPAAPIPWTKLNGSPMAGTTYTDAGLANGTTYWYYLIATDLAGNASAPSATSSAAPTAAPASSSFVPG
jgi:chitodextrinase